MHLDSIETGTLVGLRDRALIGVLVLSFARIGAALSRKIEDYYPQGNGGGSSCMRRGASGTRCRCTTRSRSTSTPPRIARLH